MQAEYIQAVVIAQARLEHRHAEITEHATKQADGQRAANPYIRTGWGNPDQAGQGATG
ncbi:hypothetical protein D9M73_281230 [compost metagenome]